jgi:hypothetical protein
MRRRGAETPNRRFIGPPTALNAIDDRSLAVD